MTEKVAAVRFYIDADVLGLGRLIAELRSDVTYPGDPGTVLHKRRRPPCLVTSPDALDRDWIPEVARQGWLIITRDSKIMSTRNEIAAVREHNAKMVALNQEDARTKWGQLEVFMTRWRDVDNLAGQAGPFIWRASRTALTRIPLR